MGILDFAKKPITTSKTTPTNAGENTSANAVLAELALNNITDGVLIIDSNGAIKMANPAALTMLGQKNASDIIGLDFNLAIKLENSEGMPLEGENNPLAVAAHNNTAFSSREFLLASVNAERQMGIAVNLIPTGGAHDDRIITFRNITKELEEEGAQMEFISTASHEMRTPVASIEGYLALALNPQTATIDARAQQYLNQAHQASQHLGHLFRDLLDVTKLDDGKLKPRFMPVEIVELVKKIADEHIPEIEKHHLKYSFGTPDEVSNDTSRRVDQIVYGAVDVDFLHEVLDNLIENAVKYTKEGGAVWVNARGDGEKILINVTDTGIGIAPDDLNHIFQKFYRADNSQTRTIGGTGLGLYLVKTRVEAMGGRVWAESSFGEGTTFYVSLPRISEEEYNKRKLALQNEEAMMAKPVQPPPQPTASQVPAQPAPPTQSVQPVQSVQPAPPAQPIQPATPQPQPQPATPAPVAPQAQVQPPNPITNQPQGEIK